MIKINSVFYIPYYLIYLFTSFGLIINDKRILFSFLIIPLTIFILIIFKPIKNINRLILMYEKTPFRNFIYLYIWLMITGFCAVVRGYYSLSYYIGAVVIGFICRGFLFVLYPMLTVPQYISIKNLAKLFLVLT